MVSTGVVVVMSVAQKESCVFPECPSHRGFGDNLRACSGHIIAALDKEDLKVLTACVHEEHFHGR